MSDHSERKRSWGSFFQTPWGFAVLWGAVLTAQAATLGVSDDEAYYWVLSQRPALGYAYHPPMVAWAIAFFEWPIRLLAQGVFGGVPEALRPLILRLPAVVVSVGLVGALLSWLRNDEREALPSHSLGAQAFLLFSLAGVFGLAWMMVPDQPLFLGWLLLFLATSRLAFGGPARLTPGLWVSLAAGAILCVLSKFSGVLAVGSAALILLWGSRLSIRGKTASLSALALGTAISLAVIVTWNQARDGGALAYQFRDRQTGGLSWSRGLRFWAIQLALCGPAVLWIVDFSLREAKAGVLGLWRGRGRLTSLSREAFLALWVLPPLVVFGVQPFRAEFKAHWIFVAWLPGIVAFARSAPRRWRQVQAVWGLGLLSVLWAVPQFPILSWVQELNPWRVASAARPDPRLDLSFDLQGWTELPVRVQEQARRWNLSLDAGVWVIGSRYQTAAQAAWALGDVRRASLFPVTLAQLDEWPLDPSLVSAGETRARLGSWPELRRPVFFVSDERYDAGPEFPNARCERVDSFAPVRLGYRGKRIELRLCQPNGLVPARP